MPAAFLFCPGLLSGLLARLTAIFHDTNIYF